MKIYIYTRFENKHTQHFVSLDEAIAEMNRQFYSNYSCDQAVIDNEAKKIYSPYPPMVEDLEEFKDNVNLASYELVEV